MLSLVPLSLSSTNLDLLLSFVSRFASAAQQHPQPHAPPVARTRGRATTMSTMKMSQCRALAGARAFTGVRCVATTTSRRSAPSNGSDRWSMKKKDSYMVEVDVAEDEPEDVAVRRFMKQVMQSRVVEQLRARRTKETKIEEYKRRFRERCEARKLGLVEPTWGELYPMQEMEPKPFDEFFQARDADDPDGATDWSALAGIPGSADDIFGTFGGGYQDASADKWGTYVNPPNGQAAGGYMDGFGAQQQGYGAGSTTWNQGGYMS